MFFMSCNDVETESGVSSEAASITNSVSSLSTNSTSPKSAVPVANISEEKQIPSHSKTKNSKNEHGPRANNYFAGKTKSKDTYKSGSNQAGSGDAEDNNTVNAGSNVMGSDNVGLQSANTIISITNGNDKTKLNAILNEDGGVTSEIPASPTRRAVINEGIGKSSQLEKEQIAQLRYASLPFDLFITPLYKGDTLVSNAKHTLVIELEKSAIGISEFSFAVNLPEAWELISLTPSVALEDNQKQLIFLTFNLSGEATAGNQKATLFVKNTNKEVIKTKDLNFQVAKNYRLGVFDVSAPEFVKAGETIKTRFVVKNKGNTEQLITLESRNEIEGSSNRILAADSTLEVTVTQKTDKRLNAMSNVSIELVVLSQDATKLRAHKKVRVIPERIQQEDPYLRFPVEASTIFSSYTRDGEHYSTLSAELRGNGYVDESKDHHIDFILRGPKKMELRRFGVADQYSVIYRYKDQTTLYLGDHAYRMDRLGFSNRYGMGFRLDEKVKDWTLSGFYSKPRLYAYNDHAVYGAKAVYRVNDSLNFGLSFSRSKKETGYLNDNDYLGLANEGQIVTLSGNYKDHNTTIEVESSASITNKNINQAHYVRLYQTYGRWNYSGDFTITDKKYYGSLKNSLRYMSVLGYRFQKWRTSAGFNVSKLNQNLDTLYFRSEPYSEIYYASLDYQANKNNRFRLRFNKRIREDKLMPRDYYYKEYGVNYNYYYRSRFYNFQFNGSLNNTKNLIADRSGYRTTYNNTVGGSVNFTRNFSVNGNFGHSFTNRYNASGLNTHYFNYNAGVRYSLHPHFDLNVNYNSGFSPEQTYLVQDNLSFNANARLHNRHFLEIRGNYFQRSDLQIGNELFAFAKYTYRFGAPLKKIINQGGILGNVGSLDGRIRVSDIEIVAGGQTVITDAFGNFELNNLNVGKNYIIVKTTTLEDGVMTTSKIPYEVLVKADAMTNLNIELMRTGGLKGRLELESNKFYSLEAYLKISNENYSYYKRSKANGDFHITNMAPGVYNIEILGMIENKKSFEERTNFKVEIKSDETASRSFALKLKSRKVKFKSNNFKIGN